MARKENNIHYIYKTTCNVTGRYYVGMHSTCNLEDGYMGSGKRLRYSIRKHGKDNHTKEIVELLNTRELLVEAEIKAITPEMIIDKNCMNLAEGGSGGHGSRFLTEEQLKKGGSNAGNIHKNKLATDVEYAKAHSDRASIAILKSFKSGKIKPFNWSGHSHTEESKLLMSNSSKGMGTGERNSQYGTYWITKEGLNKKIKKEDLETHIIDGWVKGRKLIKCRCSSDGQSS